MEAFRLSEVMLRSSQPLLPFLAPSLYRNPRTRRTTSAAVASLAQRRYLPQTQCQTFRAFSVSHHNQAEQPPKEPQESSTLPSAPSSSKDSVDDSIASILDSALDLSKGTSTAPTSRTSHFSSRNAQPRGLSSRGLGDNLNSQRPKDNSSLDDLITSMTTGFRPQRRQGGASTYGNIEAMLDPRDITGNGPPSGISAERAQPRLGPSAGRTVLVDSAHGMDIGRALRSLDQLLARNAVRRDFNQQRFHERPGMKRKRLKSVRWRANFKRAFQETVAKVKKMKKQGW